MRPIQILHNKVVRIIYKSTKKDRVTIDAFNKSLNILKIADIRLSVRSASQGLYNWEPLLYSNCKTQTYLQNHKWNNKIITLDIKADFSKTLPNLLPNVLRFAVLFNERQLLLLNEFCQTFLFLLNIKQTYCIKS